MEILIIRVPDEHFADQQSMDRLEDNLIYLGLSALILPKSFDVTKIESLYTKDDMVSSGEEEQEFFDSFNDQEIEYVNEEDENSFLGFYNKANDDIQDALSNINIQGRNIE